MKDRLTNLLTPLIIISVVASIFWWVFTRAMFVIGVLVTVMWVLGSLDRGNFAIYYGAEKVTLEKEVK
jgi:hypothetical protein